MKKIGLFYAPSGGSTEKVAKKIANEIGEQFVDVVFLGNANINDFSKYNKLIFGSATISNDAWDGKHQKSEWDSIFPAVDTIDLNGKTIALFGLGNQLLYPGQFVDSLGVIGKQIIKNGATIIGQCSTDGYVFTESEALVDGQFIGLPIDDDTEDHLTDSRIKKWVEVIKPKLLD
jgi:flavodoxin I